LVPVTEETACGHHRRMRCVFVAIATGGPNLIGMEGSSE
jgi:hypothetical protein